MTRKGKEQFRSGVGARLQIQHSGGDAFAEVQNICFENARCSGQNFQHSFRVCQRLNFQSCAAAQMLLQRLGGVVGHEFAVGNNNDLIADGLYLGEDVAGKNDGMILAESPNQIADLRNLFGIQSHRWLIQNQNGRKAQNGLRKPHTLFVALGKILDEASGHILQSGHFQHLGDLTGALCFGNLFQLRAETQIFCHRHILIKGRLLRQIADTSLGLLRLGENVVSVNYDLSLRCGEIARYHVHGGGLARTVGAEETINFSVLNGQVQMVYRQMVTVTLDQIA